MRFPVILADPPWPYNARTNHQTRFRGGAPGHYGLLSVEEIAALPVEEIAANNAILFLWATGPRLEEAWAVMKAWGFTYKTFGFTWLKLNPSGKGLFFGVGYYSKSNAEVCLLGTRGQALKPRTNTVSSAVLTPRREHSRKPDEVRERIARLYPDLPKVELFARQAAPGWTAVGDEIDGLDIHQALRQLATTPEPGAAHV